jgi:hypothetical protein
MAKQPKTGATSVISVKVTLRGPKPPIWRRLLLPGALTLGDVHEAIQAAMGWRGGHLHAFDVAGRQYGDPRATDDVADEKRLTLGGVVKSGVTRFRYTYDFGDDWEHEVVIETAPPAEAAKSGPACIAGKRACPPEDCGGIWGYQELLEILADPAHPERAERIDWLGEEFDPEDFSVEIADARLAARFGRNRSPMSPPTSEA